MHPPGRQNRKTGVSPMLLRGSTLALKEILDGPLNNVVPPGALHISYQIANRKTHPSL